MIREGETALAQKYKVKSFPQLFVVKSDQKPLKFDGSEFSYNSIFEFINVHSQIFVDPNAKENEPKQNAAAKPWLTVKVPQLTAESGNDVCLKKDGTLCVILLNKDGNIDQSHIDIFDSVSQDFVSKISRGITFNFSWLDSAANSDFASIFEQPSENLPRVIVLNPGKRKRFLLHEGDIS